MRKLVLYAWLFFTTTVICAAAFTALVIFRPPIVVLIALLFFVAGATSVILLIETCKKLSVAHTIIDSAVIHIEPAVICAQSIEEQKEAQRFRENFGIYVSSFGILLGSKVIRFNQSGIWLRKVEIGPDYISFDYGEKDKEPQNIRLLYSKPGEDELTGIIENLRKDTGVVPVVA